MGPNEKSSRKGVGADPPEEEAESAGTEAASPKLDAQQVFDPKERRSLDDETKNPSTKAEPKTGGPISKGIKFGGQEPRTKTTRSSPIGDKRGR